MQFEFTAFARTTEGRGASRRMRRAGKAPGIVYGGASAPQPIELDHNALFHALRNEAFHASILSMSLGGAVTKVLLRDVQMHPFKNEILHVDFQRVDESRKMHMKVPLHFVRGEESRAPALWKRLQDGIGVLHDHHVLAGWFEEQARLAEARDNDLLARAARRERRAFIGLGRLLHRALLETKPSDLALRALQAMARGRHLTSP